MGEVRTVAELEDLLKDDGALAVEMKRKGEQWFGEGVEAGKKAALKNTIKRLPFVGKADDRNPYAVGADLDGKFTHFGDFLAKNHDYMAGMAKDIHPGLKVAKGLAESGGNDGGFLVPEEFRAQLFALALEDAFFRQRAFTIPMSSATARIPIIRVTSHASSVFGGVTANWEPEAGTLTESEPSFSQMLLTARKLTGYTVATNELLADSAIALEALIMRLFGQAITFYEEEAFLNGTGAGQPAGCLTSTARVVVAKEANQQAATLVYENLVKMYARMLPSSRANAFWVANIDTFPQLAAMSLAVGTGGSAVWVQPGGMTGAPPVTIWGRPVVFTEHAQTLGLEGDIAFVDPSYYVIGDRQMLQMAASVHARFTTDETVWRFTERLDGRLWMDTPLTPKHGSNTLSPVVVLAVRA